MPLPRRAAAAVALAALLAGCRIDAGAVPDGYHRMPDGRLMANVDPSMGVEYRDIAGNGIELPTHTLTDGTVVLGQPVAGHDHPAYDFSFLPEGITPVAVRLPRLAVLAPVVATQMVDAVRAVPLDQRSEAVFAMGEGRPELRLAAWWTGPARGLRTADRVVDAHHITTGA